MQFQTDWDKMKRKEVDAVKKKMWLFVALCLCALLGLEIYRSNYCLTAEYYEVESDKIDAPIRIVHLSDLHNAVFGENNEDLLTLIREQQPDLILFTGDLVTGWDKETHVAMDLIEKLVEIAPLYVSEGNHERQHQSNFGSDVLAMMEYRGAKVMEYTYEDVTVKGQNLRIGGISGYCLPAIYLRTGEARLNDCEFLWEYQDTNRCTILLSHMPVGWIWNGGLDYWDCDFVFSGHAHGGQMVIPFVGGVYAPDMGLFPGVLKGIFSSGNGEKILILSSGLGNSVALPRLNNPPQILVIDVHPAADSMK